MRRAVSRAAVVTLGGWLALAPAGPLLAQGARAASFSVEPYREPASRLIGAALADRFAWHRLAELTDTVGHRLSGSPELDRAIQWAVAEMTRDGLENVHTEKVMVPRWVRGKERADILSQRSRWQWVAIIALGAIMGLVIGHLKGLW